MSRLWRTFRLGLRSLRLHFLRSFLTVLGIMFGVFSVIAMLSIGEGASYEAQQKIKALGSTNILLRSTKPVENKQAGDRNEQTVRYGIRYDDAKLIQDTVPGVKVLVQARDYPKELQFENRLAEGVVRGTVPWFPKVSNLKMVSGEFLSDLHERLHAQVCVLTPEVARKLFLHKYPIGQILKIGLDPFMVIGVAESKTGLTREGDSSESNANTIYVPLSSSRVFFGEEILSRSGGNWKREDVQLHELVIQVEDTSDVLPISGSIRRVMAHQHPKVDYEVVVPLELLRQSEDTQRMWNIVLGAIGGISLLVGGIGIMNIMLASVTERTREIGIRRALGAQRKHIVLQFLVETVVLSSLGGLMGIAMGFVAPWIVTRLFEMPTIVKAEFLMLSFGISAAVGILFGIYPAVRAASMDPIEALRHE